MRDIEAYKAKKLGDRLKAESQRTESALAQGAAAGVRLSHLREAERFREAADPEWRPTFTLAPRTGLRIGELRVPPCEDLDRIAIANVLLDPGDLARIAAMLDWEMATLGDPLMDLGALLGYWSDPDDPKEMRGRPCGGPTYVSCSLSRMGVVGRYVERSGRPVDALLFYYVFALFKLAVIVQQIYKLYVQGHMRDPRFATFIHWVLGVQAKRALERDRIHGLGRIP